MRVEERDLAVADDVPGVAPAQLRRIEDLDLEAMLRRSRLRGHDRLGVGRTDHQQPGQREQLLLRLGLQLAPHAERLFQQRHVPGTFEVSGARHARLAVRGPEVVGR